MERRQIVTLGVLAMLGVGVLVLAAAPIVPGANGAVTAVTSEPAGGPPDGSSDGSADRTTDGTFDPMSLVGMSEPDAVKATSQAGWLSRVAMRDGESFALTADYIPTRVNLFVEDGTVSSVHVG